MKRDMDLFRDILFYIEENFSEKIEYMSNFTLHDYSLELVAEHCKLIHECGYIRDCVVKYSYNGTFYRFIIGNLTNEGYNFLESIRDEKVWKKVKDTISKENLPSNPNTIKVIVNKLIDIGISLAIAKLSS